jgi:hypothetical protein
MAMRQAVSCCLVQCWCGQCHTLVLLCAVLCCAVLCVGLAQAQSTELHLAKSGQGGCAFLVFLRLFV